MQTSTYNPFRICMQNWRPLVILIALAFLPYLVGFAFFHNPDILPRLRASVTMQPLVGEVLIERRFHSLALMFFLHNSGHAIVDLFLPSLLFPLFGVLTHATVAFVQGSAVSINEWSRAPGQWIVLLLEYLAYALMIFAAYLIWTKSLFFKRFGFVSFWGGLWSGVLTAISIVVMSILLLFLGALVESGYILAKTNAVPRFPQHGSVFWFDSTATSVPLEVSRFPVFYDESTVASSDAMIAGVVLEDVGYRGPSKLSRADSVYSLAVNLDSGRWNDGTLVSALRAVAARLDGSYRGRHYRVIAYSQESRDTVIVESR